jgi:MFS family permease
VHVLVWVFAIAFVADGLVALALFGHLSDYRIDIPKGANPFGGRSRVSYRNVLNPANYRPEGRRLWRWFVAAQVLAQLLALGFVFSSVFS